METDEMYMFMVQALFDEIQLVKKELGQRPGDKRRKSLRQTLRLLCGSLAYLLEIMPDEMADDTIQKIIQKIPEATPRRVRRMILERIKVGEASLGA